MKEKKEVKLNFRVERTYKDYLEEIVLPKENLDMAPLIYKTIKEKFPLPKNYKPKK